MPHNGVLPGGYVANYRVPLVRDKARSVVALACLRTGAASKPISKTFYVLNEGLLMWRSLNSFTAVQSRGFFCVADRGIRVLFQGFWVFSS